MPGLGQLLAKPNGIPGEVAAIRRTALYVHCAIQLGNPLASRDGQ